MRAPRRLTQLEGSYTPTWEKHQLRRRGAPRFSGEGWMSWLAVAVLRQSDPDKPDPDNQACA